MLNIFWLAVWLLSMCYISFAYMWCYDITNENEMFHFFAPPCVWYHIQRTALSQHLVPRDSESPAVSLPPQISQFGGTAKNFSARSITRRPRPPNPGPSLRRCLLVNFTKSRVLWDGSHFRNCTLVLLLCSTSSCDDVIWLVVATCNCFPV